jgi:hypothetical protein
MDALIQEVYGECYGIGGSGGFGFRFGVRIVRGRIGS